LVTIAPPQSQGGPITLIQSVADDNESTGVQNEAIGVSAIPNGSTVFITVLSEACFNPASQPGCTGGGSLDHVTVGNQTATLAGEIGDPRNGSGTYQLVVPPSSKGGDFGTSYFWLNNVQGNPTTINLVANGGGMWFDGAIVSIFSGIPSTATLDGIVGEGVASCCGDGSLTSPPLTPSVSGDFLYGSAAQYGPSPSGFGAGWNGSNLDHSFFGKADEWQVYNSTYPIGATFPASGATSFAATIAITIH
jgi:hypothetical protein